MEHREAEELLSALLDGELPEDQRRAVEAHLAECEVCRRNLESLRRTMDLVSGLPPRPAPSHFAEAVRRNLRRTSRRRRWNAARRLEEKVPYETMAILMLLVLLAIFFMFVYFPATGIQVSPLTPPGASPRPEAPSRDTRQHPGRPRDGPVPPSR